jgi:uncharacterized sporulation protein YeaH/YhbH (DUF444 family)
MERNTPLAREALEHRAHDRGIDRAMDRVLVQTDWTRTELLMSALTLDRTIRRIEAERASEAAALP